MLDTFGCTPDDVANGAIVDGITASHRNVEGGPINTRFDNSAWRVVTGLRGSLARHWDWEAFAQIADTQDEQLVSNRFIRANVQQALLATTNANGNVVCTDPAGGCVPYNIFQRGPNGESLVTQEAVNFIQGSTLDNGSTQQTVLGANLQASLDDYGVRFPSADESVAVAFGVEWRTDELDLSPDPLGAVPGTFTTAPGETPVSGAPVSGELETRDVFAQVEVPLLSGKPLAEELTLRAQYRLSDFTAVGNNTESDSDASTYGVSLAWAPANQLRLRAQFQRAVRAANVIEFFAEQTTRLTSLQRDTNFGIPPFDPCASDAPVATLEQCARTGVTAAQYGSILDAPSGQTQVITGGNPQLRPEDADTVTVGATWTPSFVDNLTLSVDYFNITIEDAISNSTGLSVTTLLNRCLITGDPAFCDRITRGPTGSLAADTPGVGFQRTNLNIATLETNGIDIQAIYGFNIGSHSISIDYAATILDTLDRVVFPGAATIESAGFFDSVTGTPNPKYRHRLLTTWKTPWNVDIVGTWRHFGDTDNANQSGVFEPRLDSVNYLDLAASWNVIDGLVLRGSVLNVLAEDPPVFSGAELALGNGNTYPTIFDTSTVFVASFQYSF